MFPSNESAETIFHWAKLERGEVATDWRPANGDFLEKNLIENENIKLVNCEREGTIQSQNINIKAGSVSGSNTSAIILGTFPAGNYTFNLKSIIDQ